MVILHKREAENIENFDIAPNRCALVTGRIVYEFINVNIECSSYLYALLILFSNNCKER